MEGESGKRAAVFDRRNPANAAMRSQALAYLGAWATAYPMPMMLVTPKAAVIWCNAQARNMLAARERFTLTKGHLACVDKALSESLATFLAETRTGPRIWVHRGLERRFMLVRAETVQPLRLQTAVGLTFMPIQPEEAGIWADFGPAFGLTPSETTITKRAVEGERVEEIAQSLSIGVETVRTHLRRVYGKLEISSREQLFALIGPFRIRR